MEIYLTWLSKTCSWRGKVLKFHVMFRHICRLLTSLSDVFQKLKLQVIKWNAPLPNSDSSGVEHFRKQMGWYCYPKQQNKQLMVQSFLFIYVFKIFFFRFYTFFIEWLREQLTWGRERGKKCSKGPEAGIEPRHCWASAYEPLALSEIASRPF